MLNELMIGRMKCPVCGRYLFGDLKFWWCPYCGTNSEGEVIITQVTTDRITARDANNIPVYIGAFSPKRITYAPYMSANAIAEVLEKLCILEEEKENDLQS
jgi:hypothetical protein